MQKRGNMRWNSYLCKQFIYNSAIGSIMVIRPILFSLMH